MVAILLPLLLIATASNASTVAEGDSLLLEHRAGGTFAERRGESAPSAAEVVTARVLMATLDSTNSPAPLALTVAPIESDNYNIYRYTPPYRVIYGKTYANDSATIAMAESLSEELARVHDFYVTSLGLRAPVGAESYYIDIYIGNRGARNPQTGRTVRIEPYYAAFADQYSEGTGFMVFNPVLEGELLKITLAHELFHLVQFAYKDSGDFLDSDLWFLEATATAMEEQLYPEGDDYIRFVDSWYGQCHLDMDTFNGSKEYGAAIFALYLEGRFGLDIMRQILESFATEDGWESIIDNRLRQDYQTSLSELFHDFIHAAKYPSGYFSDGNLFDSSRRFEDEISGEGAVAINHYGIRYSRFLADVTLTTASDAVHIWQDTQAPGCESLSDGELSCGYGAEIGLFSDSAATASVHYGTPQLTQLISLAAGWNLISLHLDEPRTVAELFNESEVERIFLYQPNSEGQPAWHFIEPLLTSSERLPPYRGIWIKARSSFDLIVSGTAADSETQLWQTLYRGWNLIGVDQPFDTEQLATRVEATGLTPKRLFRFNQNWSFFDFERQVGSQRSIEAGQGIWLYLE